MASTAAENARIAQGRSDDARITLYLGSQLISRLKALAEHDRRSVSNQAVLALEIGLNKLEEKAS